jgi:hypothetical protein
MIRRKKFESKHIVCVRMKKNLCRVMQTDLPASWALEAFPCPLAALNKVCRQ